MRSLSENCGFEKGLSKRGWRFCCEAEAEYHELR
jgi:hypothetical protein